MNKKRRYAKSVRLLLSYIVLVVFVFVFVFVCTVSNTLYYSTMHVDTKCDSVNTLYPLYFVVMDLVLTFINLFHSYVHIIHTSIHPIRMIDTKIHYRYVWYYCYKCFLPFLCIYAILCSTTTQLSARRPIQQKQEVQ